jgi:hypothetical protein
MTLLSAWPRVVCKGIFAYQGGRDGRRKMRKGDESVKVVRYTLSSNDNPEATGVPVAGMCLGSIPSISKLK